MNALDEALRAAIDGTHPFVLVDMNAPTRTCVPTTDGTGRTRISPDVWRFFTAPVEPPLFVYEPKLPEPEPYDPRVFWWGIR